MDELEQGAQAAQAAQAAQPQPDSTPPGGGSWVWDPNTGWLPKPAATDATTDQE